MISDLPHDDLNDWLEAEQRLFAHDRAIHMRLPPRHIKSIP